MASEDASAPSPRVVLFPGLGADERLFAPQRRAIPQIEVPPWLDPSPRESLADYARRMVAQITTEGDPRPLYLGGASFGGVVALEAAKHLRPRAVFLIGSCLAPEAIPPLFRSLGIMAGSMPLPALRLLTRLAPAGVWLFGAVTAQQRTSFLSQLSATSPAFLRWGVGALASWKPNFSLPVPVYQVHGARDRLLPCRRASAELIVPGAGHLVNVTHAHAVNEFILRRLYGAGAGASGATIPGHADQNQAVE